MVAVFITFTSLSGLTSFAGEQGTDCMPLLLI